MWFFQCTWCFANPSWLTSRCCGQRQTHLDLSFSVQYRCKKLVRGALIDMTLTFVLIEFGRWISFCLFPHRKKQLGRVGICPFGLECKMWGSISFRFKPSVTRPPAGSKTAVAHVMWRFPATAVLFIWSNRSKMFNCNGWHEPGIYARCQWILPWSSGLGHVPPSIKPHAILHTFPRMHRSENGTMLRLQTSSRQSWYDEIWLLLLVTRQLFLCKSCHHGLTSSFTNCAWSSCPTWQLMGIVTRMDVKFRVDKWRHRGGMSCACPGRLEVSRGIVEAKHVTLFD